MLRSNTFVVEHEGAVFIIDAGAELADVKKALGERKPNAILLTHEHFDHTLHIADYIDAFDCDVYTHSATTEELYSNRLGSEIGWGKVNKPNNFKKFHSIKNDQTFKVGGITVEAIVAPGHSEGCVLFKFGNKLFTGDVLFAGTIGRTDFIPDGDALMQESLRKLLYVQFETAYHGHGKNSEFIEQQENIKNFIS